MPDWQNLVRQRLSGLALDAEERDEVQLELTGHLKRFSEPLSRLGTGGICSAGFASQKGADTPCRNACTSFGFLDSSR